MRYLKNLRFIDILLAVSFLPLFFVLPFFMKIFVIAALFLVYKKKTFLIGVLGFCAIFLSFSIYELKDFKNYILFLVSLLIVAVLMQRTKEENFYLKLSVFLFFGFSVVLFQNIYMLGYLFFEVFLFLLYFVQGYSATPLKTAGLIYLYSLPVVVLLFLFFPRVSQKHFIFGFQSSYSQSGFSSVINTNVGSVKLNNEPVAEIKLDKNYRHLYLRGAVFYRYQNGIWLKGSGKDRLLSFKKEIKYLLKEYPTGEYTIFGIDLPVGSDYGYKDGNFVFHSKKRITKTLFVRMRSALDFRLKPVVLNPYVLYYDARYNRYAQKLIRPVLKEDIKKRLSYLIKLFKHQKIIYSKNTDITDGNNIIDELFKKKRGFCIHFASAFAIAARIAGIKSRLVGGYLVNEGKNGYYKIYQKNAHTWVEVLVDGVWKRIDPTNFAYSVSKELKNEMSLNRLDFYLSYMRFLIEEWILRYNTQKQKIFLKFFKSHAGEIMFVLLLIGGLIFYFRRKPDGLLQPLYKKLNAYPQNETVYRFLKKYNDKRLDEINELYQKIMFYKSSKKDLKKLKKLIKEFRREGW